MLRSSRFWLFCALAAVIVVLHFATDPDGGRQTLAQLLHVAWIVALCGPVYWIRRAFFPEARSREFVQRAAEHPIGAGLVVLGLCILTAFLFIAFTARSNAAELRIDRGEFGRAPPLALPAGAVKYLPVLDGEISSAWPKMPSRSVLAALVEQETCLSLKHAKCWNPRAELKTSREYGFGLGQLTVAYTAAGAERFNIWREVRGQDEQLQEWQWEDRYDARLQLRALVVMNRNCYARIRVLVEDDENALAMCDSAYNGGVAGLLTERRMCTMAAGCDPDLWFRNVELHSRKSREKWQGYGASAFDINRTHVRNVMQVRRPKYAAWWSAS